MTSLTAGLLTQVSDSGPHGAFVLFFRQSHHRILIPIGDVPRSTSFGVYISQLIRFARMCSHVDDFNTCNKILTAKLLSKDTDIINFDFFSKFYRRHFDLVS